MITPLDRKAEGGEWLDSYLASRSAPLVLYQPALILAIAAIASLPFVHIDVVVRSAGMIRPVAERQEIRAPSGGVVAQANLGAHSHVESGALLAQLGSGADEALVEALRFQLAAARGELHDLEQMTRTIDMQAPIATSFSTDAWREEYARYRGEVVLRQLDVVKADKDLARAHALAASQAVTPSEVEAREYAFNQAVATVRQVRDRSLASWKLSLAEKAVRQQDLQSQYERAMQEHGLHTITAPLSGTLEEVAPVTRGSYVRAGDLLAVISPDAAMIAEVYVQPRDIIWVRPGGHVRLQVDAFNYRDWGLLDATVMDVAGDVSVTDNKPFFRVRVRPDRVYLQLASGARGSLKKGMTLTARFVARERSLWQLMRDDAADWIDPDANGTAPMALR
jgi:multidrug efflux pump subunit AcrA (membrane-fusion protein)